MVINSLKTMFLSFQHAIQGIINCFLQERNFKIHITVSIIVFFFNFFLKISILEWCIILLCIGFVLAAELFNSAIERTIDLKTLHYHPLAKSGKDMAAGAVLISAFISSLIGLLIYVPKLLLLL
ncbi:diacylglycerol kinase family protein [Flexilinea flocculi]|uniref:Diacylglycerol kinase n=1 Tax=Flexilinea flocculi TaxID=1678840 RepID=A0A0S7BYC4_9CHLR|nr:diacylglycerol kinase family protein [Flexilinea flocculi]GAP41359.1 diacylglycerol kinase [Flexilinea flocculi]